MRLSRRLALALLSVMGLVAACSSSSSPAGGGWPDATVEGGDDMTAEAGDDVGATDGPAGDVGPQACPCGSSFTTCPASRPCVIAVATEPSCAGKVCCGPASACDGGADAGDASAPPKDSGAKDGAHEGGRDAAPDAPRDAAKG